MFPFTKKQKEPKIELEKAGIVKYKCRNCGEIFNKELATSFHYLLMYAEHDCDDKTIGCADLWRIDFPSGKE